MKEILERRSFLLVLVLVSLLFFFLLKPFLGVVFWACVIGVLFYPLHLFLLSRWGRRHRNLCAVTTLLICILIGVVPTLFVITSFFKEGIGLYQRLQSGELNVGAHFDQARTAFPAVERLLLRFDIDVSNLGEQLRTAAMAAGSTVAQQAVHVGQGTLQFFVNLALMLYLAFFLLRDGAHIVTRLVRALPLGDERERQLFAKFAEVTRATVKGNLVVAAVQGTLGGLIFWILGIPGVLLWGSVMTLLSMIPIVGAALIWLPVAIYLFATGDWIKGLVLVIFGAGVIGLVDNVLRPLLVGRDTKLPDYMVLFSTLGGFVLFGMSGFVIGPMIAVLFVALWEIFVKEFNPPDNVDTVSEPAKTR